jgi:hypothetical protein
MGGYSMVEREQKLNMFVNNKIFLTLDAIGILTIIANSLYINSNTILTLGITFVTLGLQYQSLYIFKLNKIMIVLR